MNRSFIFSVALVVITWCTVDYFTDLGRWLLPTPRNFLNVIASEIGNGDLFKHIIATLTRVVGACFIALVIGGTLGLLAGRFERLGRIIKPWLEFLRGIPTSMLFPLFIISIGIGEVAKIGIAVCATFPVFFVSVFAAMSDRGMAQFIAYERLHRRRILKPHYVFITFLWGSLPAIISGMKTCISISLVLMVVTEMFFVAKDGMGWAANQAYQGLNVEIYYVYVIASGVVSLALNWCFDFIANRLSKLTGRG